MKNYSEACEENKLPILEVIQKEFAESKSILEIGSGTGQHAVFFAEHLPHILWQPSDIINSHASIIAWINDSQLDNVLPPLELDVAKNHWPQQTFDGLFSANTVHIMAWTEVNELFSGLDHVLNRHGKFCLYGPFNYQGKYTSASNAHFDDWLKSRDPLSGIRDFEAVNELAGKAGLTLLNDYEMPVNNRILVWEKTS
jgi:cyclopropane fatty-acyl-phospholipid synthase-like methyltransferase